MATGVAAQESLDNVPINALDKPIGMFNVHQTFNAPLGENDPSSGALTRWDLRDPNQVGPPGYLEQLGSALVPTRASAPMPPR